MIIFCTNYAISTPDSNVRHLYFVYDKETGTRKNWELLVNDKHLVQFSFYSSHANIVRQDIGVNMFAFIFTGVWEIRPIAELNKDAEPEYPVYIDLGIDPCNLES